MTTEDKRMIPLSVVDALILKLEKQQKEMGATLQRLYKIEILQEIKKEAIPSPSELEQKIKARIAYLEKAIVAGPSDLVTKDGVAWSKELHQARLDELRKLLPK
jgi:hypothetical protein